MPDAREDRPASEVWTAPDTAAHARSSSRPARALRSIHSPGRASPSAPMASLPHLASLRPLHDSGRQSAPLNDASILDEAVGLCQGHHMTAVTSSTAAPASIDGLALRERAARLVPPDPRERSRSARNARPHGDLPEQGRERLSDELIDARLGVPAASGRSPDRCWLI